MLTPSGGAMGATLQGAQAGMAAGPMGALAGGAVGLLSQSEQFQGAMEQVEGMLQSLADSVGALLEPILPLLDVTAALGQFFGALIEALKPLVELVMRPLYAVFKAFALAIMSIVKAVAKIINGITGIFGKKAFDTDAMDRAMRDLKSSSYDAAPALDKVTKSAESVSESLGNAARAFKVSLARFNAVDAERQEPPAVNVVVGIDGKELARDLEEDRRLRRVTRDGTTRERAPRYATP
jgi:hypothetical protein